MGLRQNALLLATLTALLAIVADWTGDPTLTRLWRLPAGLLLLGLAYEMWWTHRARVQLRLINGATAVLGRAMPLQFIWSHGAPRAVTLEFAPAGPASLSIERTIRTITMSSGAATVDELTVTPRQLGAHVWPKIRARIAGPLGLAWWRRSLAPELTLHVAPDLLRAAEQRGGESAVGAAARRAAGGGAEILQLRDYRPDDGFRSIDWKATARRGRLISRDFSEDQHLEIVIAIDAGRASRQRCGELDRLGHYANIAARFAQLAIAQDDRVGIVAFADQPLTVLPPMRGVGAVLRVRRMLAALEAQPAESNPLYAAARIAKLVRHRSLIVMLTDLDDATVASQLAAAMRLLLPKHLPLVAGLSSPEADRLAHQSGRAWLDAYESLAAREYSERLQGNVRALHSLGAPAVATYPDQLERAVFAAYRELRARRRV